MRVLIVNNGVRYPSRIAQLFRGHEVEVLSATEVVSKFPVVSHDCIILTGSNQKPIPYFHADIHELLTWIPNQTRPLWGICYGAELIAEAYGGKLHHLGPENKVKGFYTTNTILNDYRFFSSLCLYESHQWIIEAVQPPLRSIITSSRGVLMFEHASLPQIGTMFHPEKYQDETDGRIVIDAIFARFGLR